MTDIRRFDPAIDQPVRIAWRVGDVDVTVADVNVAPLTRAVRVDLAVDEVPRVQLELDPVGLLAHLTGADVVLELDQWLREALAAAGWTHPDVDPDVDVLAQPIPGEPTHDLVVESWTDVPEAIRGHAMFHARPGIHRHSRLGITIVVLGEVRRELEQADQRAELLRRQVAELEAELTRVRDAPLARRHADGSLSVEWAEGQTSCLMGRAVLDGILLERATLRGEVERLRGLLARALDEWHADVEFSRCSCHQLTCGCVFDDITEIRREAGLT
jgi:hypothetical protein